MATYDGGGTQRLSRLKADTDQVQTLLLSNQGKTVKKFVDVAGTVMETKKTIVMSRPHGYNRGGIEETDIFPTVRKSSTMGGNNGVVEWKK